MTGWRTDVEVNGIAAAQRVLGRIQNLDESVGEILGSIGDLIESTVRLRFRDEKGPGGVPWPKSKRALGKAPNSTGRKEPGRTLFDTGELQNSLAVEKRPREVEIGFRGLDNPVKARANQYGVHGQSVVLAHTRVIKSAFGIPLPEAKVVNVRAHGRINNLPARPMLGMDDTLAADIEDISHTYLLDLLHV